MMKLYVLLLTFVPTLVSAQPLQKTGGLIDRFGDLVVLLINIAIALALLVFVWGLVKFITKAGDEGEVKKGKGIMTWGLIALFVMISVWGLVRLMQTELGLTVSDTPIVVPKIPRY